jgi:hypothetical protein
MKSTKKGSEITFACAEQRGVAYIRCRTQRFIDTRAW